MPTADMILWAGMSGLIALLLVIIGWLVNKGFEKISAEISALRLDIAKSDEKYNNLNLRISQLEGHINHCSVCQTGGRRGYDPPDRVLTMPLEVGGPQ